MSLRICTFKLLATRPYLPFGCKNSKVGETKSLLLIEEPTLTTYVPLKMENGRPINDRRKL